MQLQQKQQSNLPLEILQPETNIINFKIEGKRNQKNILRIALSYIKNNAVKKTIIKMLGDNAYIGCIKFNWLDQDSFWHLDNLKVRFNNDENFSAVEIHQKKVA